jgi:hypothetical protein
MPWRPARAIASRVAWYIAIMPLWLPPSNRAETPVSDSRRTGRRGALNRGCSATFRSFGSPEYS